MFRKIFANTLMLGLTIATAALPSFSQSLAQAPADGQASHISKWCVSES